MSNLKRFDPHYDPTLKDMVSGYDTFLEDIAKQEGLQFFGVTLNREEATDNKYTRVTVLHKGGTLVPSDTILPHCVIQKGEQKYAFALYKATATGDPSGEGWGDWGKEHCEHYVSLERLRTFAPHTWTRRIQRLVGPLRDNLKGIIGGFTVPTDHVAESLSYHPVRNGWAKEYRMEVIGKDPFINYVASLLREEPEISQDPLSTDRSSSPALEDSDR